MSIYKKKFLTSLSILIFLLIFCLLSYLVINKFQKDKDEAMALEPISINLLTSEQLNLFRYDNLPLNIDKNFAYLNIQAQDIRGIIRKSIQKSC